MLFADMALFDGAEIPPRRLVQPRIEGEIAFVLGRELALESPAPTDILRAVEFAVAAIEIVDSRIEDWDTHAIDAVADNASAALFVLGTQPRLLKEFDVIHCGMVLEKRGAPVSIGAGANCMGNPLRSLQWLANAMVRKGTPLQAGDTILSGALGPMAPALPGDSFEARISGLGSVRLSFVSA
jgi:2-keto-4-pentenoate hydratase